MNQQLNDDLRVLAMETRLDVKEEDAPFKDTYRVILPENYDHILNCICVYHSDKPSNCKGSQDIMYPAKRMTSDAWSVIMNNYYNRPKLDNPYYFLYNVDNSSTIKCEIRCGNISPYKLVAVIIDYLRAPKVVKLTQRQIDLIQDTSEELEWPDYMCNEITNEMVNLVMTNIGDPRLQTQSIVTKSIASPSQQQTQS